MPSKRRTISTSLLTFLVLLLGCVSCVELEPPEPEEPDTDVPVERRPDPTLDLPSLDAFLPSWERIHEVDDDQHVVDIAVDSQGDIVVLIYHRPTTYPDGTCTRVTKYSPAGDERWSRTVANTGPEGTRPCASPDGVAIDPDDNIVIVGTGSVGSISNFHIFVAKLDSNGNDVWSRHVGGGLGMAVAVDGGGNVYFGGDTDGQDSYLAKFDPDGNLLWEHIGTVQGYLRALAVFPDDDVAVRYSVHDHYTEGGAPRGYSLRRLDPQGDVVWTIEDLDRNYPTPGRLVTSQEGDLYTSGALAAGTPMVRKYDGLSGAHVWTTGVSQGDVLSHGVEVISTGLSRMAIAADGTLWFGGSVKTLPPFEDRCPPFDPEEDVDCSNPISAHALLHGYSPDGELIAARTHDGAGSASSIAVLNDDQVVLGGCVLADVEYVDCADAWIGVVDLAGAPAEP